MGARDQAGLTKPCAFVVAEEPGDGLARELQAFVRETLEPFKYPREVLFLDSLPRTHLGKVDRGSLRERATAALGGRGVRPSRGQPRVGGPTGRAEDPGA